jgi:fructosamine-3-kinase
MATRLKMPAKGSSEEEVEEAVSQLKRPERGRYFLKVDRQTKGSYTTAETAQAAALAIKKNYPIVQVSIYDSVDNSSTLVEAPAS